MKTYINDMQTIAKLIELSINCAKLDLISPYSPVVLLVDIFDVKTPVVDSICMRCDIVTRVNKLLR